MGGGTGRARVRPNDIRCSGEKHGFSLAAFISPSYVHFETKILQCGKQQGNMIIEILA